MSQVKAAPNIKPLNSPSPISASQRSLDPDWLDRIDIIIKTFLRPVALLRLLESIAEFYPGAHVTIVDDGNLGHATDAVSKQCVTFIKKNPQIKLIDMPYASGVVAGRNALVEQTQREFVLLLDDDFCFTPATKIERMLMRLEEDSTVGLVAGVCIDLVYGQRRRRRSGGTLEIDGDTLVHRTQDWRNRVTGECDYVPNFFLARRALFDDVRWDIGFGGEHYDFLLQLLDSEWKVVQDDAVQIDHYPLSDSFPEYWQFKKQMHEFQKQFLKKWNLSRMVQDGNAILTRDADAHDDDVKASENAQSINSAEPDDQQALLSKFWSAHAWPRQRPDVPIPEDNLGWFLDGPQEMLTKSITPDMQLIVELGAWLGMSTRFIADLLPDGKVITIDHWNGSPEHQKRSEWSDMLPTLFETFLMINWDYRQRILPLRISSTDGLKLIHSTGLIPDLIFVDADHAYESVLRDLTLAHELFPHAVLVGDDYDADDVRRALSKFAQQNGLTVEVSSGLWRGWRLVANRS